MKTKYLSFGVIWEWDDQALKWENLGKVPKEEEEPRKIDLLVDWRSWSQFLLATFKAYRESTAWNNFLETHDESDNKYFEMLEAHYKNGKLKVAPWLEESTNGTKQLA